MKKWRLQTAISMFVIMILLAAGISGCGSQQGDSADGQDDRLKVVCTIFPEYDWVKQIAGEQTDHMELTLLLKNGSDLHSYQPTVWDMVKIAEADLFVYVGGESDFWVADALANAKNPNMKVLNLMEILEDEIKEEEHVEGMQAVRGHDHDHEDEPEYDEHVWLSLRNAKVVCHAIADALCELDEEHGNVYEQNRDVYLAELDTLDEEYTRVTEQAAQPVLLFGDRFPFRYLVDDYELSYYAAFSGCSAETEASFETITFLAGKVDELSLPAVLTIDGSDQKIARTIADNAREYKAEVWMLDSMQSVSETDMENGENYLSIMEKNLEVLRAALPGIGR